jgi:histidinol phosphatase-like enzyme
LFLGVSNQSGIEKGDLTEEMAKVCFKKTNDLLGFNIDVRYCPHHSFPIRCFCRKPLSGLGVYLIETYKLNPSIDDLFENNVYIYCH